MKKLKKIIGAFLLIFFLFNFQTTLKAQEEPKKTFEPPSTKKKKHQKVKLTGIDRKGQKDLDNSFKQNSSQKKFRTKRRHRH
jgi:hypothetical protein